MRRLGFSFDYARVFYSSDEGQYRWSQWLFLTLLDAGLIYRDDATVDWCDHCQTTLASLQVEDGRCWRCHNEVRLIRRPTWFLRIAPYLEENDRNLDRLKRWDELSLATQRYILGRSDGAELDLDGSAGYALTGLHPLPGLDRRGAFRAALAAPPRDRGVGLGAGRRSRAGRDALRRLGAQRPRRVGSAGDRHRGIGCRSCWRRASGLRLTDRRTPALARPRCSDPAVDESDEAIGRRMPRTPVEAPAGGAALATEPRDAVRYPRLRLLNLPPALPGGRRFRVVHCLRRCAAACPSPLRSCRCACPRDIEPTGEGRPTSRASRLHDATCPRVREPAKRETDTFVSSTSTRVAGIPAAVPPETVRRGCSTTPTTPVGRLPAGRACRQRWFRLHQRVITKALRTIGPLSPF